ncbi:heterokaryon incompatibility protein-domain-containing protein [Phaeosphaeria sp. MPI-PUGE-AT-0046c]|nr:heterokaryon incompatibility protein-domain-containing protein [Phaeosphaeria sp. MPI-PUGE-AT-0046c]
MASHSISEPVDKAPDPLFAHTPLDLTKSSSLRLLRILPISPDGTIECELFLHDFEDGRGLAFNTPGISCTYDALSYEWGPDEPPFHWIRLNGLSFRIRHNLYCFLQVAYSTLRFNPDLAGLLWIDAICIDQENLSERGHQVKQMGRIYKSASTVLVWLGPDVGNRLGSSATHDLAQWTKRANMAASSMPLDLPLQPNSEAYVAFRAICEQSYWTRMWIIQEIHFAKKALLIVGGETFAWEPIRRMLKHRQLHFQDFVDFPALQVVNYLAKNYTEATVCDLVYAFGNGKCSDIRDRVYAILALLPSGLWFQVDYTITKVELLISIILASYGTKARLPELRHFANCQRLLRYGLSTFNRKRPDAVDLTILLPRILGALHVSFRSLHEYLAHHPGLGLDTLVGINVNAPARMEMTNNCEEHLFPLASSDPSRPVMIVLKDLQPRLNRGALHRSSCRIIQKRTGSKRGPSYQNETLVYTVGSPLIAYWRCDDDALWLSFHTVMFLARSLHTIRDLTLEKLDEIATHDRAVAMSVDDDGTRHILVDISSQLADVEF